MLIDTHAHLNFVAFKKDADDVITRSLNNKVWMINVGSNYRTSKRAVEIAERYSKGVYAAIGLHPIHLATGSVKIKTDPEEGSFEAKGEDFEKEKYKELAQSPKVVAIGEIGLDYYYRPKTKRKLELFKEKQKGVFLEQLKLAQELNLPVIFHCRVAHQDLIEVLKSEIRWTEQSSGLPVGLHSKFETNSKWGPTDGWEGGGRVGVQIPNSKLKGAIHCFTGTWEQAKEYLQMGFYLGFNGIIFKSIQGINFEENIKKTPLDKILIETDCPYLTPSQVEGRNEPIYVKYIAQKIARIKNISYEEIEKVTTNNAKELFQL